MPAGPVKRIEVRAIAWPGPGPPTGMPGRAPTAATAPGGGAPTPPPAAAARPRNPFVWTTPLSFLLAGMVAFAVTTPLSFLPAGMVALAWTTPSFAFLASAAIAGLADVAGGAAGLAAALTGTGSPQG